MLAAIGFLSVFSGANAQNVFVSPQTGKLIAALTSSSEVGFQNGWNSLWKHDQLPLTITVADDANLTDAGDLSNPAANINVSQNGEGLILMGGQQYDSYMSVTLPKGYRFTGYSITLQNNMDEKNYANFDFASMNKVFYETNDRFDKSNNKAVARITAGDNKEYAIERQSKAGEDMGNHLYFLLARSSDGFYGVTIKSFEIFFTTDGFSETMSPSNALGNVSFCQTPFFINKLDLGEIKKNTKNSKTYYSYNYQNVKDVVAYNLLYQDDAVQNGVAGDYASTKNISSLSVNGQNWFALGNDTYYAESPMNVTLQDGKTVLPVGYRITGAKLKVIRSNASKSFVSIVAYKNGTAYYLNTDLKFTTTPTEWVYENKKLRCGDKYLDLTLFANDLKISNSVGDGVTFEIENGKIHGKYVGGFTGITYDGYVTMASNFDAEFNRKITSSAASYEKVWAGSDYTLKVFGTDKDNVVKTVAVNASSGEQTVEINNLNNDAVKFAVEGLQENTKAIVQVELTMEYLNPYVSSLDVVCKEKSGGQSVKQTLDVNNFEVRGGEFKFYVPDGAGTKCSFSFENLKSNYADNTYYNGEGNGTSQYNFVNSEYWTSGKGTKLYEGYDPNAAYDTKVSTTLAGTVPFRFSNIDELNNTSTSGDVRQLEEYPFSIEAYQKQTKPGAGEFKTFELSVGEKGTAYLFVADEPRYNIAPTTGEEHRCFAYYRMSVELSQGTYEPKVDLTKIYDSTCYDGDETVAMYGAKVTTVNDQGAEVAGSLSTEQIWSSLEQSMTENNVASNQVLYVDLSGLNNVVATDKVTFENLRDGLSSNTLVYLPKGVNAGTYNYASRLQDGSVFYSGNNMKITDKQPFFAPYGITVPAEQYVEYARKITTGENGKVATATVMLPFTISIDDKGLYTNADGTSLSVWTMQKDNFISTSAPDGNPMNYKSDVHFVAYTSSTGKTEADVPYMVKVENGTDQAETSFVIKQYGSNIEATKTGGLYTGDTSTGKLDGSAFTFTPKASYAGLKLEKTAGNYFYFGKNMFLNSKNISGDYLYCYPFRAVYEYGGNTSARAFNVTFGENFGDVTGIETAKAAETGVEVAPGAGCIEIHALKNAVVVVYDMSGMVVERLDMIAGDTQTVNLPAGIYLVNKNKVSVK